MAHLFNIEKQQKFLPEILFVAGAIIIGLTAHFILESVHIPDGLEYMYIFVAEIFVLLFYCGHKIYQTYENLNEHHNYIEGFITTELHPNILLLFQRDLEYYKGENEILKILKEKRSMTRDQFYAIWCVDYEQSLDDYFLTEKDLDDKVIRYRLINKDALAKNKNQIKKHLCENKEPIINDKYYVYSTTFSNFEFVICFRAKQGEKAVAIQLFKNRVNPYVEFAISSAEESFVGAMIDMFRFYQKEENRLKVESNDAGNFDEIVENWLSTPAKPP